MLVSTAGLTPGQVSASTPTGRLSIQTSLTIVLKKRVAELEEEVNRLKDDNEKLVSILPDIVERYRQGLTWPELATRQVQGEGRSFVWTSLTGCSGTS